MGGIKQWRRKERVNIDAIGSIGMLELPHLEATRAVPDAGERSKQTLLNFKHARKGLIKHLLVQEHGAGRIVIIIIAVVAVFVFFVVITVERLGRAICVSRRHTRVATCMTLGLVAKIRNVFGP